MKIISVRLKNLNSLSGETFIDFSSPVFEDSGIFAIVGPTGSGKTTILDAICLALYGQTPRLGKITASDNEIMSRQANECAAEVVFETNRSGRFLCRWQQQRTKAGSKNPFGTVKHQIMEPDGDEWKPLDVTSGKVPVAVEEKTGMSFDQFTRSMMLAQGEFTRFLKSDKEERGNILEKITGLRIYGEVSRAVFERHRTEKQKLEDFDRRMEGITLLDEAEENTLKAELAELENRDTGIKNRIQLLRAAIQHLDKVEELRRAAGELEAQWREHEKEFTAFAPQAERLALAGRALNVEAAWETQRTLRMQRDTLSNKLVESKERLPKADENFQSARNRENEAAETLKMAQKRLEDEKPILREVAKLDERILLFDKEIVKVGHHVSKSENGVTTHRAAVTAAEKELAKLFPGDEFSETEKEADRLSGQAETLLDGKQMSDLLAERQTLNTRSALWEKLVETLAASEELAAIETRWKTRQTETGEAVENLHRQLGERTKEYENLVESCKAIGGRLEARRRIRDFEAAREQLEDGAACPLCGSPEHPFARGNVPVPDEIEKELAEEEKKRDAVRAELERLRVESAGKENLSAQAKNFLDENAGKRKTLAGTLAKYLEELELDAVPTETVPAETVVAARIEEIGAAVAGLTEKIDTILRLQGEVEKRNKKLAKGRERKNRIEKEQALLEQVRKELETRQAEKAALAAERQEKVDDRARIYGEKIPVEAEKRLEEDIVKAEKNLESVRNKRVEAETLWARTQAEIESTEKSLKETETNLVTVETTHRQRMTEMGFETEADFQAARLPQEKREELENRKTTLALRRRELETLRTKNAEDLKSETSAVDPATQPVYVLFRDELVAEAESLESEQQDRNTKIVQLRVKLEGDAEARKTHRELAEQRQRQKEVCRLWNEMDRLIGSSKGVTFKVFAQGLTFRFMIEHANAQLRKMTDRYVLIQSDSLKKPLEMDIVDTHQNDAVRSTRNLSGGESFLVSLALALGLSSMSSNRIRIDSLFLDEGFGTLDDQILETALAALQELRAEGKLVGVISHMSKIQDRISPQIQLCRVRKGQYKVRVTIETGEGISVPPEN